MSFALKQMQKLATSFSPHKEFKSSEIINFLNNNISLGKKEYEFMLHLIGQSNNCNGVCFPSGEYLAEAMGVSRPRVMQLVKQLKDKGVLIVEKIRQGESFHNFYIIPTLEHFENLVVGVLNDLTKKVSEEIKSVMHQASEKAAEVVETVQEVADKVKKVIKKFTKSDKSAQKYAPNTNAPNNKSVYGKQNTKVAPLPKWMTESTVPSGKLSEEDEKHLEDLLNNL